MLDFAPGPEQVVRLKRGGDVDASVRPENSAHFAKSLIDAGSERIGVRDVLRAQAATRAGDAAKSTRGLL